MDPSLPRDIRCVLGEAACNGSCPYHLWLKGHAADEDGTLPLLEARRLLAIYPPQVTTVCKAAVGGIRRAGHLQLVAAKTNATAAPAALSPAGRVVRFMRLLAHLETAPWANLSFDVNRGILRRLAASHVHLIAPGGDATELLHIIDPKSSLAGANNLVWVTNRQQGKTTTLGKFIAAMSIACPLGGLLACVYSTSLGKAQELTNAAKEYVRWMGTPEGRSDDFPTVFFETNNTQRFVVNNGAVCNTVCARPKNTDSCRGDNPRFGIVDEVAFVASDFWYKFVYPLLQVGSRAFTCATTPPPPRGFFQPFLEQVIAKNKEGDNFFTLINHSLSCGPCLAIDDGERCCHHLHLIPPWKSLVRFNQMKALVPASKREDFATEVYGVLAGTVPSYLPKELIAAAVQRERHSTAGYHSILWVGIDPASHGVSDMGMCAFVVSSAGMHIVAGLASVNVSRCQTTEVQAIVRSFLSDLRSSSPVVGSETQIVPIIECNNNEVLAMSILRTFQEFGPVWMPFTDERFGTCISSGIGVWTTHENKMAGIQSSYQALLDGRVTFAEPLVTTGANTFRSRAREVDPEAMVDLLAAQLFAIQDQPDGTVSGKTLSGGKDDLAMAFIMAVFWSLSVRAHEMQASVSAL